MWRSSSCRQAAFALAPPCRETDCGGGVPAANRAWTSPHRVSVPVSRALLSTFRPATSGRPPVRGSFAPAAARSGSGPARPRQVILRLIHGDLRLAHPVPSSVFVLVQFFLDHVLIRD